MKILILEANPDKDLSLDKEIRELRRAINDASDRNKFQIKDGAAVKANQMQKLILEFETQDPKDDLIIVHFCGHGTGQPGLVFENENGEKKLVSTDALASFFELFKNRIPCVVMNACYSEVQADEIIKHIKYVIGMNQAIRDDAAIAFSIGFYRALGYGRSIEDAYKFGKNAIQLHIDDGSKNRKVIAQEMRKLVSIGEVSQTVITEEYLKPVLKINPNTIMSSPIVPEPKSPKNEQAIATWRRRLSFFEAQLPIASVNEKFIILENIEECKQKIQELER